MKFIAAAFFVTIYTSNGALTCKLPMSGTVTEPCTDTSPWVCTHADGRPGPMCPVVR